MAVIFSVALSIALFIGGALGWLLTVDYYKRLAALHREYEREVAVAWENFAALALLRRTRDLGSSGGRGRQP